jgi:hypothetical protein
MEIMVPASIQQFSLDPRHGSTRDRPCSPLIKFAAQLCTALLHADTIDLSTLKIKAGKQSKKWRDIAGIN